MAFIVVYDACVLYPAPLRDLLMRLAEANERVPALAQGSTMAGAAACPMTLASPGGGLFTVNGK
jgi:hypothetical protein